MVRGSETILLAPPAYSYYFYKKRYFTYEYEAEQRGYDHVKEASQKCQPDPGAGGRVPLMALVGQFRLDYGAQGLQRLVRLVDVCLHDGTSLLDDS